MKFEIDLLYVTSGPFFFASGKRKPDAYRFERVKGKEHVHRLTVQGDKSDDILADLGLRLQQIDIPVLIRVIVEPGDLDGAEAVEKATVELATLNATIVELQAELAIAKEKKSTPTPVPTVKSGPTKEQEAMLLEQDAMREVLAPFAEGDDTPLDVLKRLVAATTKPEATPKKKPGKK